VHGDVSEWSIKRHVAPEHLENREKRLESVDVSAGASLGGKHGVEASICSHVNERAGEASHRFDQQRR
jgi:hypothetical protein